MGPCELTRRGDRRFFQWSRYLAPSLFESFMREDLLGYLLGALEPHEMRSIADQLRRDPGLRAELDQLKRMLEPLEDDAKIVEPPAPDLVTRTLSRLPPLPNWDRTSTDDPTADRPWIDPTLEVSDAAGTIAPNQPPLGRQRGLSVAREIPGHRTLRTADWITTVAAAAILGVLIVPSLVEGRFQARNTVCQDHLRELGTAVNQFVTRNAQARLPSVERSGHRAFAGVYAPHLRDAGLLSESNQTWCPSWSPAGFWQESGLGPDEDFATAVTLEMIDDAARRVDIQWTSGTESPGGRDAAHVAPGSRSAVDRLRYLQAIAGGQYAYTLGVRDNGGFGAPRFQGRSSFAVMSDAVLEVSAMGRSARWARLVPGSTMDASQFRVQSHDGRGINVLYEDGRVRFIAADSLSRLPDHPLVNHVGRVEAGLTVDDASLAPSWQPPFASSRQR